MPEKTATKIKKAKTPSTQAEKDHILITGDLIIDHNIYLGSRLTPASNGSKGTTILESYGGAGLLYCLVNELMKTKAFQVQFGFEIPDIKKINQINLEKSHHSYSVWTPCPKAKASKDKIWRMTQPLGYGDLYGHSSKYNLPKSSEEDRVYKIVVLDDGALGFRNGNNKAVWPGFLTEKKGALPEWIIYKMSSPIGQGDLFREVSTRHRDRLIILVSINDLRREEVGITKGLSWERTAVDLISSLKLSARINKLMKSRHLIINLGSEGVLWINNQASSPVYKLVFDPAYMERDWDKTVDGSAYGFMSCLSASVINQLILPEQESNIGKGIMAGLSAMRCLNISGHGDIKGDRPGFPYNEIAQEITASPKGFASVDVPAQPGPDNVMLKHWTIMEGAHGVSSDIQNPFYGLARRVALFGPKALSGIPYSRFGKLFTVDRKEIESLRGVKRLISQYEAKKPQKKPLSISVFGPPGSGKSFNIKQIAKTVMGKDVPILEFNLSQFLGPEELTAAFHQVRDMVLKGTTPCVFWDEFDSKEYSWFQYLLAPMQDGEFREGQLVHPIGKCVFVFAGGTSFDMENFVPDKENAVLYRNFKFLKGPDFVSRLNGYINVLGPNKRQVFDKTTGQWLPDENPKDLCFPVRRALLMRGMLGLNDDDQMKMDSGLLTALLGIDEYKHGARSLETILTLIRQENAAELRRSDLPPREQISLHVDFDKFLEMVNRDLPFKMKRESIAPAVQEYYRKLGQKEGWIKPEMDKDYNNLDEFTKESNLAAAERIPEVLSLLGLQIEPGDHPEKLSHRKYKKILEDTNKLELTAEAEHNGWMEFLLLNGWVYDEIRNNEEKKHNLLVPYHELSETNKDKDRSSVRSYYEILENAGYDIIQSK